MSGGVTHSPGAFAARGNEVYLHTALRGVAALCVVAYHASLLNEPAAGATAVGAFFLSSYLFVDLFFLLSGFIMVESYAGRMGETGAVLRFWWKRLTKILPNYYIWLGVAIAVVLLRRALLGFPEASDACVTEAIWRHLLLIQNLAGACLYFNTPLWSIVVELLAYMLFPLLVLGLRVWALMLGGALALYAGLMWHYGTMDLLHGAASVLRCLAGFVAGMALARAADLAPRGVMVWAQLPVLAAVLVLVSAGADGFAVLAMTGLVYVTARNLGPLLPLARSGLGYILGRASFSIYLVHIPLLALLNLLAYKIEAETGLAIATTWWAFVALNLLVSGGAGVLAYLLVEQRIERALQRRPQTLKEAE